MNVEVAWEKVRCFKPNTVATVDPAIADVVKRLIIDDDERPIVNKLVEEFPIKGEPKEFCIRKIERVGGFCLGYSVKHEEGEWRIYACKDYRGKYLMLQYGPIASKILCKCRWSFASIAKVATPAELVERLNKILLRIAKSS